MRFPNGYGSVVKLGGNRRKPYAVRITTHYETDTSGATRQKYKYLEYFEKLKDAHEYLAKYNAGYEVKEHISLVKQPTFSDIYHSWIKYKTNLKKSPTASTLRNYNLAYGWCKDLHKMKFASIKLVDIQNVVDKYKEKSLSTVATIKTVLNQMYQFAMKHEYVDKNYAILADYEYKEHEDEMHIPFSDSEIQLLWNNLEVPGADLILMMIYTGFRASEFISIKNANINLDERYIIGGIKTSAGRNRTVPLNKKVIPLFKKYYTNEREYLIPNSKGNKYSYGVFNINVWIPTMERFKFNHTMHDTRHTLATLLDRANANKVCIKKILGHSIQDLTDGTYTHKTLEDLLEAIDLI